jgi:hypothetical protein
MATVDYPQPVEAFIPGVPGRVLGVLARTESQLTMRTVARLARVSANRAAVVRNALVSLGVVERRAAGSALLVQLGRQDEASQAVLALSGLRDLFMARMRHEATAVSPSPISLIVFGSFVDGTARASSDLDILAIRPIPVPGGEPTSVDSLGKLTERAGPITGTPGEPPSGRRRRGSPVGRARRVWVAGDRPSWYPAADSGLGGPGPSCVSDAGRRLGSARDDQPPNRFVLDPIQAGLFAEASKPPRSPSGRADLNRRPHGPEPCTLTGLSYFPRAPSIPRAEVRTGGPRP